MEDMLKVEVNVKASKPNGDEFCCYVWRVAMPRDYFEMLEAQGIEGLKAILQASRAARGKGSL